MIYCKHQHSIRKGGGGGDIADIFTKKVDKLISLIVQGVYKKVDLSHLNYIYIAYCIITIILNALIAS